MVLLVIYTGFKHDSIAHTLATKVAAGRADDDAAASTRVLSLQLTTIKFR
jgi:hypothetical protein